MSIAEKLLVIAENVSKVYEAGQKSSGGYDTAYNEGYDKGYSEGETAGYGSGYTDGRASVPDLLSYSKVAQFSSCNVFGKSTIELNLSDELKSLSTFIQVTQESNKNTILEHLSVNCSGLPTTMSAFMSCNYAYRDTVLKKITLNFNTQNVTNFSNAFGCLVALEEIDGTPLDFSSATGATNTFNYNNALKEVRFKASTIFISINFQSCSKLSAESVQSIIDGLADLMGADSQTITFHSSIVLTDEQKATITSKNWTLVQ